MHKSNWSSWKVFQDILPRKCGKCVPKELMLSQITLMRLRMIQHLRQRHYLTLPVRTTALPTVWHIITDKILVIYNFAIYFWISRTSLQSLSENGPLGVIVELQFARPEIMCHMHTICICAKPLYLRRKSCNVLVASEMFYHAQSHQCYLRTICRAQIHFDQTFF